MGKEYLPPSMDDPPYPRLCQTFVKYSIFTNQACICSIFHVHYSVMHMFSLPCSLLSHASVQSSISKILSNLPCHVQYIALHLSSLPYQLLCHAPVQSSIPTIPSYKLYICLIFYPSLPCHPSVQSSIPLYFVIIIFDQSSIPNFPCHPSVQSSIPLYSVIIMCDQSSIPNTSVNDTAIRYFIYCPYQLCVRDK